MEESRPNIGVLLPTREAVISGRSDPSVLFQLAERAEVLGFNSVWVGDSLTARPRIDTLTTLTAVGARTKRVRLGNFFGCPQASDLVGLSARQPGLDDRRPYRSWRWLRSTQGADTGT